MSEPIRVIIVDDHPIYRSGISATLGECGDIEVVGQGASADDALRLVASLKPDVALLDISMPGGGLHAAAGISAGAHPARVVMLTASEDETVVTKALEAGAVGYALKGIGGDELIDIIRAVVAGGAYVSPTLAGQLLVKDRNRREVAQADPFGALSHREIEIARLLTNGMSNKEIARQLDLQEKTIKHHMTQILQKLRLRNRVEAAMAAREYFGRAGG